MKDIRGINEIRTVSHVALVLTTTIFSVVLISLNMLLGWEHWTIPICAVSAIGCLVLHINNTLPERARIYIYSMVLMIEMFYYSVNVETLYDCTPVVVLALVIFVMTQEKSLTRWCMAVGYLGMIWHLTYAGIHSGLNMSLSGVVRTVWHMLIVLIAGVATTRLVGSLARGESKYREYIASLEDENKSAGDFLASVSHEIRLPINAVIEITDSCEKQEKDPELKHFLKAATREGKKVAMQIGDILDYAEIEMKKLTFNNINYRLSSVLEDVISSILPYKSKDIELVIDVEPSIPAVMNTDVGKLKKILLHLIMNAIEFTRDGGVYVRIYPVRQEYGMNLCIDVSDTGVGMKESDLDRIFERFYKADNPDGSTSAGLGLGMSIVAGFVRYLGGFITIDSAMGEGTKVSVSIPQVIVDDSECMVVSDRESMSLGGYFHYELFPNPHVREFYENMIKNIACGLRVPMHRVQNGSSLKTMVDELKLTHMFVGSREYESDPAVIEEIARGMYVFLVAEKGYALPEGSAIRLLEKPFYCFNIVRAINQTGSVVTGNSAETDAMHFLPEITYHEAEDTSPAAAGPAAETNIYEVTGKKDEADILEAAGIDTGKGLMYSSNDRELYETLLRQFVMDSEEKLTNAGLFFDSNDLSDYEIVVHALKSTAQMIGAMKLSDEARLLERAAKGGDGGYIRDNHARVMEIYRQSVEAIAKAFPDPGDDEEDVLEFAPEGGDLSI